MLIDVRKKAGKTQKEVAEALEVRQATYSAWETGKNNIPYSQQVALADYFEVPVSEIVAEPNTVDALSDKEKLIIKQMRRNYPAYKSIECLSKMISLASLLKYKDDDRQTQTGYVMIQQLLESDYEFLLEYYSLYETNYGTIGKVAQQRLDNAENLVKAARKEFDEFVKNDMKEFVPEIPF